MTNSRQRGRWALLGAVALLAPLLQTTTTTAASAAAPPVTIRVPLVAEPGQVPPAVVAGGHTGDAYSVVRVAGGEIVTSGELTALDARAADAWTSFGLADLSGLEPGTYRVEADGATSTEFTVSTGSYAEVLTSLLGIFDANADGDEPSTYHDPSHLNDARSKIRNGPHKGERIDVEGGWMDAGDQIKFTTTIGYASTMLELAARNEPTMADDLIDASGIGIRWLVKAHPRPGVFAAMVGQANADHNTDWRDPAGDDALANQKLSHRSTSVFTSATGGSDAAGTAAAALAYAADRSTGTERSTLIKQAKAWLGEAKRLGAPWHDCCYPGDSYRDDLALAEAALWRVTGTESYATAALTDLRKGTSNGADDWRISADGYEMAAVAAAELCGVLGAPAAPDAVSGPACDILAAGGQHYLHLERTQTAFGRTGDNTWGSVRENEAGSLTALLAARSGVANVGEGALRGLGWFLGVNPWGLRWEVGFGIDHPHHWLTGLGATGQPVGAIPGGPTNLGQYEGQDYITRHPGPFDTDEQYYGDYLEDYVANEIGIDYNAPAMLHFALVSPG